MYVKRTDHGIVLRVHNLNDDDPALGVSVPARVDALVLRYHVVYGHHSTFHRQSVIALDV